jgi:hypothetical protein
MSVLEKEIETELIRRVQDDLGGISLKTHVRHWPDRICFLPGGRCFFVETKRPKGGLLSRGQLLAIGQLKQLGHNAYLVWDLDDIDEVIKDNEL